MKLPPRLREISVERTAGEVVKYAETLNQLVQKKVSAEKISDKDTTLIAELSNLCVKLESIFEEIVKK